MLDYQRLTKGTKKGLSPRYALFLLWLRIWLVERFEVLDDLFAVRKVKQRWKPCSATLYGEPRLAVSPVLDVLMLKDIRLHQQFDFLDGSPDVFGKVVNRYLVRLDEFLDVVRHTESQMRPLGSVDANRDDHCLGITYIQHSTGNLAVILVTQLRGQAGERPSMKAINDGDPKTKWQATKGEKTASVEIDLGKPTTIQCISLVEPWHPWSGIKQQHELQYLDGSKWTSIFKTETDGTGLTKSFIPVTARKFKLLIENSKEAPALLELLLFRAD